ncbi:hypothetical protein L1987_09299 [Smallanthus sonchifolius]|uniref:Uncharacterized protein n=1 Tax=Smallanthus sonchifolius TaxID=185202 RepID=A0ACB9JPT5_9ASTR|nr:hypothetical protein L1987_09299 [Smallanthus sonchifolius]
MSSYSTGSKSYYSVTSDDEEPTEVTSENHLDGSIAELPSNGRKSPFYVPGGPSYSEPEMQTPTQGVEEPNYGARESWMIEMFQMKADIEDDQIRIIKRLQASERHKREQLATNEMFAREIGSVKEDLVITREEGMATRDATLKDR